MLYRQLVSTTGKIRYSLPIRVRRGRQYSGRASRARRLSGALGRTRRWGWHVSPRDRRSENNFWVRGAGLKNDTRKSELPSFEDIYTEQIESVFYWFLHRGIGRDVAAELAQDTFVQAYKGFDEFRGEASPRTWIYRIARNIFKNHLRSEGTQKRDALQVSMSGAADEGDMDAATGEIEVADPNSLGPEEQTLAAEENEALYGSLKDLPPQMRQCIELRLEDLRYREIAEIMGISIETVKSHLHQGRQRLRNSLGEGHDKSRKKK